MTHPIRIQLPAGGLREVKNLCDQGKKIQAIKYVRSSGRIHGREPGTIGLRESKLAVDHLQNSCPNPEAILVPDWVVHSVIVSGPAGEKIELDVENLQMHFLTSLSTLGLHEVAHLVDLVDYINSWQSGQVTGGTPEVSEPAQ